MSENWSDPRLSLVFQKPYYEIYAGGIPFKATEDQVREYFEQCGSVVAVIIPINRLGNSIGAAFVIFERESEAKRAIAKLDHTEFMGRTIFVEERHGRTAGRHGPRMYDRDDFDRRRDDYDYGRRGYFGRDRDDYDRGRGDYGRGRDDYDRGRDDYDRGRNDYDRGRDFDRGRDDYDFDRDRRFRDDFDRDRRFRDKQTYFEEDPDH